MKSPVAADYTERAHQELTKFYADRRVDQADTEAKIAALRKYLEPTSGGGMMIASADGIEGPEFELKALEYLYLVRLGFDE